MTHQPPDLSRFVSELRRRHVFRATVAYAAVAFVVLQGAEIVVPAFDLPAVVLQLVVVGAVLGLPVAAALAWVYEITPRGIRTMRAVDAEAGITDHGHGDLVPRVALLAVTVAAVAGAGWWWFRTSVAAGAPETGGAAPAFVAAAEEDRDVPIRSLAVLPLDDFSPGGGQDYFAAGMHESLISHLSQMGSVRVLSRTSVTSFDASGKSAVQVGRELGAEGLVEGSVTVYGDSVRITVQLIHAPSDTHLWTAEYERELRDLLGLQREVARAIAREIEGELAGAAESPMLVAGDPAPAAEPAAAMEEMRGRQMLSSGEPGDLEQAEAHLEQALRQDPGYAPALVSMAGLELLRGLRVAPADSVRGTEALAEAEAYVERALESDPSSREALEVGALIDRFQGEAGGFGPPVPPGGGRFPPTLPLDVRVVGGDSATVVIGRDSLAYYVPTVTEIGSRVLEHMASIQGGVGSAWALLRAARNLEAVGRRDRAEDILRRSLREFPGFTPAWEELEHLLVAQGDLDGGVQLRRDRQEAVGAPTPGAPSVEDLEAAVSRDGIRGYWSWRLEEMEARAEAGEDVSRVELAAGHAALGDADLALGHLDAARAEGDPRLYSLRSDPVWDPIRDDPRFRSLLRQLMQFRRRETGRR